MILPSIESIDFQKFPEELIPAIIQDKHTSKVLMLGYMDKAAYQETLRKLRVTFYSRSKKRLWTKGEKSGDYLMVREIRIDCDKDALLIKAQPLGPTCHTGADSCWSEENEETYGFLSQLEEVISHRRKQKSERSYISKLFEKGINKIAQKFGEEAVELIIESKDESKKLFLNEAADLLFHYLILLQAKNYILKEVVEVLKERNKSHQ
ncbi:bifunctional phosphoribosyl-AMP cyclohydrolase/phosphoribosyl-ATP diphosphatase HisIE [Bacteroidetes bacterium endosymbiont of Geopemphigus sp.]|uniref:bifunctional phosphoribosyl-AMP cyclohydrolase/phosphoribosyl-ATP diphosphatase HisIE n=1 Tax=Bacteroidetes bacterium endosymbiont of Geopemphigus sp. TaxID=2047937 RepID=UPI000CD07408|nr:bifunctional phosphoribosyl-AMP cyclohydrolase/phosphoribosyl-ATP diphosphatase HisIE [Bacteroidetes bacterium endosymbiont of Geopemphigus sp.]